MNRPREFSPTTPAHKPDWITWVAAAALAVFFIFPQIPIQIRYVVPFCFVMFLLRAEVIKLPIFVLLAAYTGYVTVLGLLVARLSGDGTTADALYGLKPAALCTLVMIFGMRATVREYALLISVALIGCAVGMVLDRSFGPIYSKMPFPIFSQKDLIIRGSAELTSERYGGFTYEAGVAGGMSAIFMLMAFAIIYLSVCDRRLRLDLFTKIILCAGVCCGFLTIAISKTKTSLVVFLVAGIALCVVVMAGGRKAGAWWAKSLVVAGFFAVLLSLPLAYKAVENTGMGEYIKREVDNLYLLATRGFDRGEGLGLNTRIECAKKAIYALPFRPTGAGFTSGYFYVEPILEKIDSTPEMEFFHNQGVYDGYKGAFFNVIGTAGLVGLGFLGAMWSGAYRALSRSGVIGGTAAGALLIAGLWTLGLAVEMLPYIEISVLVWCFAWIAVPKAVAGSLFAAGAPPSRGQPSGSGVVVP